LKTGWSSKSSASISTKDRRENRLRLENEALQRLEPDEVGNLHVRFLGEELAARSTPYPTGYFSDLHLIHHYLLKMEQCLDELMDAYLITISKEWM
jgi:hypothetical protein